MSVYSGKIFSKKFNIFILVTLIVFFCSFSIFVNVISFKVKSESRTPSLDDESWRKSPITDEIEKVCLNGLLFNSNNGKIISKVFEKEEDPVYLMNGSRVTIGQTQAKCS